MRLKQLFLISVLMVVFSSLGYAAGTNYDTVLNPFNATHVYHYDDGTSTAVTDSLSGLTCTETGGTWTSAAQVGTYALDYDDGTCSTATTTTMSGAITVSGWYSAQSVSNDYFAGKWDDTPENSWRICNGCGASDGIYLYISADGTNNQVHDYAVTNLPQTGWYNYVLLLDPANDRCDLWVNNTFYEHWDCGTATTLFNSSEPMQLSGAHDGGGGLAGISDEVIMFDHIIDNNTIGYLYNTTYPTATSSAVFVNPTPTSGTANSTAVVLNATCIPDAGIYLYFDNNTDPTTLVLTNATAGNWTTNVTYEDTYYYKAACADGNGGVIGNTSILSWTYDVSEPAQTLNPANGFNATNQTTNEYSDTLPLDITITDNIDLFGFQINITSSNGSSHYSVKNETLSGLSYTFQQTLDVTGWANGLYNVEVLSSDSHTAQEIDDYQTGITGNKIVYDTAEGNRIVIQSQAAAIPTTEKTLDSYTFTFDFTGLPSPTKIFFVECDNELSYRPDSAYKGHFTCWNPDTKNGNWIDWVLEGEEQLEPVVELVEPEPGEPTKYKVTYETSSTVLKFKSIGGLNINIKNYLYTKSDLTLDVVAISPTVPVIISDLLGNVQANQSQGKEIRYDFIWYKNGAYFRNGSSANQTAGLLVTVDTVFANQTLEGENWTFSARAWNDDNTTLYINSSSTTIQVPQLDNCTIAGNITYTYHFYDELNGSQIGVDVTGTYNYSIDNGTYQQYALDMKGVTNFSICTNPAQFSFFGDYDLQYSNSDYPARNYVVQGAIFDVPLNTVNLLLLNAIDGIYVRFRTVTVAEAAIIGVLGISTDLFNSVITIMESDESDSSGLITMFMDPNKEYTYTFSKAGFLTQSFDLRATSAEIYTVTMGSTSPVTVDVLGEGLSYAYGPSQNLLANNTNYTFTFNLNSSFLNIAACTFELIDENSSLLGTASTTFSNGMCNASIVYDTGTLGIITGRAIYNINSTQQTYFNTWAIQNIYVGQFSIQNFIDDLNAFSGAGFNNRTRLLIAVLAIAAIMGVGALFAGLTNADGQLILLWLLTVFFSYMDWLNLDYPNFPIQAVFMNQWFISIIVGLVGLGFLMRRNL